MGKKTAHVYLVGIEPQVLTRLLGARPVHCASAE
jgi:hypothetical protein